MLQREKPAEANKYNHDMFSPKTKQKNHFKTQLGEKKLASS